MVKRRSPSCRAPANPVGQLVPVSSTCSNRPMGERGGRTGGRTRRTASTGTHGGPGRVLVGWSPCDCERARVQRPKGPGHLTVRCRAEGCRSIWHQPRHDHASGTWGAAVRRPGLRRRPPCAPARPRASTRVNPRSSCTSSAYSACGRARKVFRRGLPREFCQQLLPGSAPQRGQVCSRCAIRSCCRCSLHPTFTGHDHTTSMNQREAGSHRYERLQGCLLVEPAVALARARSELVPGHLGRLAFGQLGP
jgi:hypothetical protein